MNPSPTCPPSAPLDSARTCVLIVEDELLIRLSLSEALRDEGYHVVEAYNADEALVALETTAFDLVISDVRMPGSIDGLALLAVVRKTFPMLPVIMMSGHLMPSVALADGAIQFLPKPFATELMVKAVQDRLANPR